MSDRQSSGKNLAASHPRVLFVGALSTFHSDFLYKLGRSPRSFDMVLYGNGFEPDKFEDVYKRQILERLKKGKPYSIVVVAEGIQTDGRKRAAEYIAQEIEYETGIETRETVLGYIQRGGSPTPFDRNLSKMCIRDRCFINTLWN